MNIKLDENVHGLVIDLLRQYGHSAETVQQEGLSGEPDSAVMEAASSEQRLLMTFDRRFADVRRYPLGQHPGIVVIRTPRQRAEDVAALCHSLLRQYRLDDPRGCIVVLQENGIRIRRSPTV